MDLFSLFIPVGVALGLVFLVVGAVQTVSHSQSPTERRLNDIKKRTPIERELVADETQLTLSEREEARNAPRRQDLLPLLTKLLSRSALINRLETDLRQSRSNWRASEIVYASLVLMAVSFLILSLITKNVIVSLLVSGLALLSPFSYVRRLRAKYLRMFGDQLADTLVLMSNALKSGYGFMQAVEMVAREADPPICDEFKRMFEEIQVGRTVEDALDDFAERIGSTDVNLLVMAVIIQRQVGGALAEILDTIAAVIRERVTIQGEIRTLTTQGRMSGLFLSMMPIGLGVVINVVTKLMSGGQSDSYMKPLLTEKIGKYMIAFGVVMQLIGFFVIRKIVTIEV